MIFLSYLVLTARLQIGQPLSLLLSLNVLAEQSAQSSFCNEENKITLNKLYNHNFSSCDEVNCLIKSRRRFALFYIIAFYNNKHAMNFPFLFK